MVHGNGGARTRFELFEAEWRRRGPENVLLHFPALPGFEGRSLPREPIDWNTFLEPLRACVKERPDEPWICYGHGIGGSILLEWSSRCWSLGTAPENGPTAWKPEQVILHGSIGASLEHRLFPRLMQPNWIRKFVQWLIYQPWLRPLWEKKLFLYPHLIPDKIRRQFFEDYKTCRAFPFFFDLITPQWYREVRRKTGDSGFYFLWGTEERVVASKFVDYWRRDFSRSVFEIVPGWDHFPMLDQPSEFFDKIIEIISVRNE